MDAEKLQELISQKEGLKLDFKREYKLTSEPPTPDTKKQEWEAYVKGQWDEFIKDVLALANGNSGTANQAGFLIVGADDELLPDGTRRLYDTSYLAITEQQLLRRINGACSPALPDIHCERIVLSGKNILVIEIPPSPHVHETTRKLETTKGEFDGSGTLRFFKTDKVYTARTVFIRHGEGIEIASDAERRVLALEKSPASSAQKVGQVASLIDFHPEYVQTLQFVLSIQGDGPDTVLKAITDFGAGNSLTLSSTPKGQDILQQLRLVISEYTTDLENDLALVMDVLRPAVDTERTAIPPLPGRFLDKVIQEIGHRLHSAHIFDTRFSVRNRPGFERALVVDGYRKILDSVTKLPMPAIGKAFDKDGSEIYLVRSVFRWEEIPQKSTDAPKPPERTSLTQRLKSVVVGTTPQKTVEKPDEFVYALEYRERPMRSEGDDYHILFDESRSEIFGEVRKRLAGWDAGVNQEEDSQGDKAEEAVKAQQVYPLSTDVFAKFLRAILHNYILYMRYQKNFEALLNDIDVNDSEP